MVFSSNLYITSISFNRAFTLLFIFHGKKIHPGYESFSRFIISIFFSKSVSNCKLTFPSSNQLLLFFFSSTVEFNCSKKNFSRSSILLSGQNSSKSITIILRSNNNFRFASATCETDTIYIFCELLFPRLSCIHPIQLVKLGSSHENPNIQNTFSNSAC